MTEISHFQTIELIREFFKEAGFLETPTPPLVHSPGMEAHLHPFKVQSRESKKAMFLHTSPEFFMKKLLSENLEKIYSLSYCFRDEPRSATHRPQFLMLEWYRSDCHYDVIKKDVLALIEYVRLGLEKYGHKVNPAQKITYKTVDQIFQEELNFSILDHLEVPSLKNIISTRFPELVGNDFENSDWPWEDYFFLIFLNKIEPLFSKFPILMLDEFPAPLAALSTLKTEEPRVCERFEVYLNGIELCNCFNELTNLDEQKKRYQIEKEKREALYNEEMPVPDVLFEALEKGLTPSAGIALGVERLLLGLTNLENFNPFFE